MAEPIEIADVATRIVPVETSGPARGPRWIERRGGGALRERARNPLLDWRTAADVAVNLYRLADAVLDADTMMVLCGDRLVGRTNYLRSPQEVAGLHVEPSRLVEVDDDRPVLMCGDAWSANHYHWLNHTLPTIAAGIGCFGGDGLCLAMRAPTPVQEEMLRRLGYGAVRRVTLEAGRQYRLREAVFCDYAVGLADFACAARVQDLAGRLAGTVDDAGAVGRRIYVSRLDATHRRLLNEGELVTRLARRGFAIVDPGRMDFAEQVAAFRGASLVVGPHGAGLANTMFCRAGALVYELLPGAYPNACMVTLSVRRDGATWVDAFDSPGEGPAFLRDWSLDIDAVLRRLDEIEGWEWRRWWRLLG